MASMLNHELCKLQAINKRAVIWSIQEFNDWNNRTQGARVRQMEEQKYLGWQKEKRLYLEQRCLWNLIANPLKEEYLVNKQEAHPWLVWLLVSSLSLTQMMM